MIEHGIDNEMDYNRIYQTNDYDKFRFSDGNRPVREENLKKLRAKIIEKDLLHIRPIQVLPNFEIFDGQHRFTIAKELELPIYYTFVPYTTTTQDLHVINEVNNKWTHEDHVYVYAQNNVKRYRQLYEDYQMVKETNTSTKYKTSFTAFLAPLCSTRYSIGNLVKLVKTGAYEYDDADRNMILKVFDELDMFNDQYFYRARPMVSAYVKLRKKPQFKLATMRKQYRKYREMLEPKGTIEGYYKNLLTIYNFYLKKEERIPDSIMEIA